MNIKKITVITVLVSGFIGAASAQDKPPMAPEGDKKPPMERMLRGDKDGDGVVSKAEWLAESEARFAEIDADKDGKITGEEFKAHRETKRSEWKEKRGEMKGKRGEMKEMRKKSSDKKPGEDKPAE